jgi:hypothetical protein
MLLMEPNDAPQLPRAEDVVQLPGGLGRGGVPRLKLHGFHRSSSASFNGGSGGSGSARSGAGSNKSVLDTLAEPSPYTMPEVVSSSCPVLPWRASMGHDAPCGRIVPCAADIPVPGITEH